MKAIKVIGIVAAASAAIAYGNAQQDTTVALHGTSVAICGNGVCDPGEDELICPPCAVDESGAPMGDCSCMKSCSIDCPDGDTAVQSGSACRPYVCDDGTQHPRCNADGTPIPYTEDPCLLQPAAPVLCNNVYHPGDQFPSEDGCNICMCMEDGNVVCTDEVCLDTPDTVHTEEVLCEGKYKPGEGFMADDGCNTCSCLEDGTSVCTEMYCGGELQAATLCEGQYQPGDVYTAADGCNMCRCNESGFSACTRMECLGSECALHDDCPPLHTCDRGICVAVQSEPDSSHDSDELIIIDNCGHFMCQGVDGIYEVSACDADGNILENPCDQDDYNQRPEYEEEIVTVPVDSVPRQHFSDVEFDTLEGLAANALASKNIIGGFPDGTFRPFNAVNRAEAAKFLLISRYRSVPNVRNNGRFKDLKEGEWYVKYVIAAAHEDIINGYPDGTFRPAQLVNTAEFLKMLANTFSLSSQSGHSFLDVPRDAWFAKYAWVAKEYDLFPGRVEKRKLMPERFLSRGDVAIAIYRLLQRL